MFLLQWIEHDERVPLPPQSLDLSSLNYFLLGHLKTLVYAIPLYSDEDLVARISEDAARVREIAGIFEGIRQSLPQHFQACIVTGRRKVEQFL
ncbi:uncharacterized protein TNCV_1122741 [Trichonephila clavipes]|uniref:Uncharacterized protein n=1 Tax=Trichonephila clavipes TaxID=2585209 RepID=A0A8X6SCQ7_TRICX|nr:uncharacterized protein TNCV_1122741 [Trichonephila clavipes]